MSWETVGQAAPKTVPTAAPVSMSLIRRGQHGRLYVTLSPATLEALGWDAGARIGLEVGRGANAGLVRLKRERDGRPLRILPNSQYRSVELALPEDLARWQAPRRAAEHDVLKGGILVATMPWVFREDGAQPEAGAEDGAEAAAA